MKLLATILLITAPLWLIGQSSIVKAEIVGDTLFVTTERTQYEGAYGSGITCAVAGCDSDHQTYIRERIVIYYKDGRACVKQIEKVI